MKLMHLCPKRQLEKPHGENMDLGIRLLLDPGSLRTSCVTLDKIIYFSVQLS